MRRIVPRARSAEKRKVERSSDDFARLRFHPFPARRRSVMLFPHPFRSSFMPSTTQRNATKSSNGSRATPLTGQSAPEIQPYGTVVRMPVGLDEKVRQASVERLNQV